MINITHIIYITDIVYITHINLSEEEREKKRQYGREWYKNLLEGEYIYVYIYLECKR